MEEGQKGKSIKERFQIGLSEDGFGFGDRIRGLGTSIKTFYETNPVRRGAITLVSVAGLTVLGFGINHWYNYEEGLAVKKAKEDAVLPIRAKLEPVIREELEPVITEEVREEVEGEFRAVYNDSLDRAKKMYGNMLRAKDKELMASREEEGRLREASLDSFLARYPEFNKDRDYISSIGYWGSKPSEGAIDFVDYELLRRSLEFILEGHDGIVKDVLAGKAVIMTGEVAKQKTRDLSVLDDEKYVFMTDVDGNPKGYGMDFDQYEGVGGN